MANKILLKSQNNNEDLKLKANSSIFWNLENVQQLIVHR